MSVFDIIDHLVLFFERNHSVWWINGIAEYERIMLDAYLITDIFPWLKLYVNNVALFYMLHTIF